MKTEYEVRILEINAEEMINKLEKLGATKIGEYDQKRYVYDIIPATKRIVIHITDRITLLNSFTSLLKNLINLL